TTGRMNELRDRNVSVTRPIWIARLNQPGPNLADMTLQNSERRHGPTLCVGVRERISVRTALRYGFTVLGRSSIPVRLRAFKRFVEERFEHDDNVLVRVWSRNVRTKIGIPLRKTEAGRRFRAPMMWLDNTPLGLLLCKPTLKNGHPKKVKVKRATLCKGQIVRVEFNGGSSYEGLVSTCHMPNRYGIDPEIIKSTLALEGGNSSQGKYANVECEIIRKNLRHCGHWL
ncbi:MAG: hypothetical protein Q4P24_08905, partial [Rhodobacterales bacterium]|nr:hypothetical protein [Rhodobacterales bacterium]